MDNKRKSVFNYLKENGHINYTMEEFEEFNIEIHESAYSIFDSIYFDLSLSESVDFIDMLRQIKPEELVGYDNVQDFIVKEHDQVTYIHDLGLYLYSSDFMIYDMEI